MKTQLLTILMVLASQFSWAQGFNELIDEKGQLRPQYQSLYPQWQKLSEKQKDEYLKASRKAFQGDNALDPMPRILTGTEVDQSIKPGVEQRAKALQMFLQDYFSGKRSYDKAGVVPQAIVERIAKRAADFGYQGVVDPKSISFMYGPDIIRDEKGVFRVIEDNPGFIGGLGDLRLAYEYMLKTYGMSAATAPFRNPEDFYRALAESFLSEAKKHGGKAIIYMVPPYPDKEDYRIREIFKTYGVETISPRMNRRLEILEDGVYLRDYSNSAKPLEKVGYMTLITEHQWADPNDRYSQIKLAIGELQELLEQDGLKAKYRAEVEATLEMLLEKPQKADLQDLRHLIERSPFESNFLTVTSKKSETRGLVQAIMKGQVGSNYTPGLDFIGDKEFYVFVEDMIRFYLKEEPILRNIPTERFGDAKSGHLNDLLFQKVFKDLSSWVIKKVDGRGGDAVWVGPKIKSSEISDLKARVKANPDLYIAQKFTPLSYMNENIVDMRVITQVMPKKIIVADTPWGRGLPKNGNGKVNLSDQGREITILVQQQRAPFCKAVFN